MFKRPIYDSDGKVIDYHPVLETLSDARQIFSTEEIVKILNKHISDKRNKNQDKRKHTK